jgi:hypothetical protein
MTEYRGYWIYARGGWLTGTDSIRRPDGSWRFSPPTWVGGDHEWWVIARRSPGGELEEVAVAATEELGAAGWTSWPAARDVFAERGAPGPTRTLRASAWAVRAS